MSPIHYFKTVFLLVFIIFNCHTESFSQNTNSIKFGNVSPSNFDIPVNKIIDSNTNAVIISNVGSLDFVGNKHNWISYSYKESIRIKILNNKAYTAATTRIRLYGEKDDADVLDNLHASTYNLVNGKVEETNLPASDIFTEQIRKGVVEKRFTMPNVKEGSIIEYTYTIISYRYYQLPEWTFQNFSYPTLYSEYKLSVPDLVRYAIVHYGTDSFNINTTNETFKVLTVTGTNNLSVSTPMSNHIWAIKNIPAFAEEKYINQPRDYFDKLEFVLTQASGGEDVTNINTNWKNAEDRLLENPYFGTPIKTDRNDNLISTVTKICLDGDDALTNAKNIYSYVRDNFTCAPDNEIYYDRSLYDINKARKGSVAELNMLLIGLLRLKNLYADPVILSTREYGMHPANYPVLYKMNYVVCLLRVARDTFYLDASDPLLGFGKLPLSCYNGHAQIIDANHSGSVFFYADNVKEKNTTFVNISNSEDGNGRSGSFESTLGYFQSYDLRKKIKEKTIEKYISEIKTLYGSDYDISNVTIDSLNNLDYPVKIKYDINFKAGMDEDIIYFNPFIEHGYKENPFKADVRKYAVEMPYSIDDVYELSMDIPKGYKVDELPKTAKVSFNATDGVFDYVTSKDQYLVQMKAQVKILPVIFAAEDYTSIRDFFSYIVKKESEQIVFKKN
jgi:hypothetical protein